MRTRFYKFRAATVFITVFCLSLFVFNSCDADEDLPSGIANVQSTGCKNNNPRSFQPYSANQECIEYEFVTSGVLEITHINMSANCCPGGFIVDFEMHGDTIIVFESSTKNDCRCICLYDLNYSIKNIALDKYFFRVEQGYPEEYEKLEFEMDLNSQTEGVFCVDRNGYPWNN
ncbi:MAG: hypothetical protein V1720_04635 [bacterium]